MQHPASNVQYPVSGLVPCLITVFLVHCVHDIDNDNVSDIDSDNVYDIDSVSVINVSVVVTVSPT